MACSVCCRVWAVGFNHEVGSGSCLWPGWKLILKEDRNYEEV